MNSKKNITVAFTGHREYSGSADEALRQVVRDLYNENYRIFLCGMARGFDLAAGECIIDLRNELADIELVCVIPFYGQEQSFSQIDRERFHRLTELSDDVILLANEYSVGAFHSRNNFMINKSSVMVAYYNSPSRDLQRFIMRKPRFAARCIV